MLSPFLWHKEEDPWIVENEVLIAKIKMSEITGQLSQGQRGSHTVHGVWETLQLGEFCEKTDV